MTQVVVPVGGGGLIAGRRDGRQGALPRGARDRGRAGGDRDGRGLDRRRRAAARARRATTIADALGPPSVGAAPLAVLRELLDEAVAVSEEQIAEAFRFLYARAKLAVEPAAAAPVAALLAGLVEPLPGTVLVLSGGNVDGRGRRGSLLAGLGRYASRRSACAPAGSDAQSISTRRNSGAPSSWVRAISCCISAVARATASAERRPAQAEARDQAREDVARARPELRDVRCARKPRAVVVDADDVLRRAGRRARARVP